MEAMRADVPGSGDQPLVELVDDEAVKVIENCRDTVSLVEAVASVAVWGVDVVADEIGQSYSIIITESQDDPINVGQLLEQPLQSNTTLPNRVVTSRA